MSVDEAVSGLGLSISQYSYLVILESETMKPYLHSPKHRQVQCWKIASAVPSLKALADECWLCEQMHPCVRGHVRYTYQ
jgi:hypothetical protein